MKYLHARLVFGALVALCLSLIPLRVFAADPITWDRPYYGFTLSPDSPLTSAQMDQLQAAGTNWIELSFNWNVYEPTQGQYNANYVQLFRAAIDDGRRRGWKVALRLSWQYAPDWATALPGTRFVDQYGQQYVFDRASGKGVVAFTFNQNLRTIITATMRQFFTALQNGSGGNYLDKVAVVSFGGGFYGEVNLPEPGYGGKTNCFWAYTPEAIAMFRTYLTNRYGTVAALNTAWGRQYASFGEALFVPGQTSSNHQAARDFLNWLVYAQQQYVRFQRNLIRESFDGYINLELGGWGMRPNYVTENVNRDLDGTGPGADSISKVYDFPAFLDILHESGERKVIADCTWVDPNPTFGGPTNPTPAAWIASYASQYGYLTGGEYAANSTALDLGASRMHDLGLVYLIYVPVSRFFSGSAPSIQDWAAMIKRSNDAYRAGTPYLAGYDIGSVGAPGTASLAPGAITVTGSGTGFRVGGTSDAFHYRASVLEGDGDLVANLAPVLRSNPSPQVALMVREGTGVASRYTALVYAGNQYTLQSRTSAGSAAVSDATMTVPSPQPTWLKLQRSGNVFTASYSYNGADWTVLGTKTNVMPYAGYIGVAVSSGSTGTVSASFSSLTSPYAVTVDDSDADSVTRVGTWSASTATQGYYGTAYLTDGNTNKGASFVTYTPKLGLAGTYDVYLRWTSLSNRASNVPVQVHHAGGTTSLVVNQQINGGVWFHAGTYQLNTGGTAKVVIQNAGTNGYVVADAVQFVRRSTPTQ